MKKIKDEKRKEEKRKKERKRKEERNIYILKYCRDFYCMRAGKTVSVCALVCADSVCLLLLLNNIRDRLEN